MQNWFRHLKCLARTTPEDVFEAIRVLEKAKRLGCIWDVRLARASCERIVLVLVL